MFQPVPNASASGQVALEHVDVDSRVKGIPMQLE